MLKILQYTYKTIFCQGHHGHSHDQVEVPIEESIQATARGFLIVFALSIHGFFEGIALGVTKDPTTTFFLLAAFASHKWVISGTVGLNWARSAVSIIITVIWGMLVKLSCWPSCINKSTDLHIKGHKRVLFTVFFSMPNLLSTYN